MIEVEDAVRRARSDCLARRAEAELTAAIVSFPLISCFALLRAEPRCRRKPPDPLNLSLSERCDPERFARHRPLRRQNPPN